MSIIAENRIKRLEYVVREQNKIIEQLANMLFAQDKRIDAMLALIDAKEERIMIKLRHEIEIAKLQSQSIKFI